MKGWLAWKCIIEQFRKMFACFFNAYIFNRVSEKISNISLFLQGKRMHLNQKRNSIGTGKNQPQEIHSFVLYLPAELYLFTR